MRNKKNSVESIFSCSVTQVSTPTISKQVIPRCPRQPSLILEIVTLSKRVNGTMCNKNKQQICYYTNISAPFSALFYVIRKEIIRLQFSCKSRFFLKTSKKIFLFPISGLKCASKITLRKNVQKCSLSSKKQ